MAEVRDAPRVPGADLDTEGLLAVLQEKVGSPVTATTFLACPTVVRQVAKGQGGLNHYQVRGWIAGHKHVTLAMFALPFLAVAADDARVTRPSRDAPSIEAIR